MPIRHRLVLFFTGLLLLVSLPACRQEVATPDYVARLNDQYLTRAELEEALRALPAGRDTSLAREQIIEQWLTNALLFEEARRRGLHAEPEVQRLLRENERSVLVSALLKEFYEEPADPASTEVRAYYERHKEQLRLREPYLRVRALATLHPDSAATARGLLQRATYRGDAEGAWPALVRRFAHDPEGARLLAEAAYPESRLFSTQEDVHEALGSLREGQIAPIVATDSLFYLIQVVERFPAGSTPRIEWVGDEIERRLGIEGRKQLYARQVQRLRNEALSRDALEIR